MVKESKQLIGALLTPSLVTTLPMGRLVKLTDDLESFRELIDCKTIEHLSMGWAPGVVLDAFMDEEGMLARKRYFVFQGTKFSATFFCCAEARTAIPTHSPLMISWRSPSFPTRST